MSESLGVVAVDVVVSDDAMAVDVVTVDVVTVAVAALDVLAVDVVSGKRSNSLLSKEMSESLDAVSSKMSNSLLSKIMAEHECTKQQSLILPKRNLSAFPGSAIKSGYALFTIHCSMPLSTSG